MKSIAKHRISRHYLTEIPFQGEEGMFIWREHFWDFWVLCILKILSTYCRLCVCERTRHLWSKASVKNKQNTVKDKPPQQ